MNPNEETARVQIAATGWRMQPWGSRVIVGLAATVLILYYYSLFGPPVTGFAISAYLLILVVLIPTDAFFELTSERSVVIRASGVVFDYPLRKTYVPWDRLKFNALQLPPWTRTVTFLEVGRMTGLRALAHRVTIEQGKAILQAMPSAPTDPRARALIETAAGP